MIFAAKAKARGLLSSWRDNLILAVVLILAIFATSAPGFAKPQFSAITVDARTGKVLFARDADGLRHPASLTKVMTLYVLFQDLKTGRVKLSTQLRISKRAANMDPSKLGLKPGQTISVETAIKALVTKSANDVASAIGENLGGTEAAFAIRMTKVARSLGMSRTTFKNSSGLPNPGQWTTARDMATLSLRIQRDFPQYYPYFRIASFNYKGKTIRTHNKLLGRYEGTDGIKTGYIRASGFNLTTSAKRGDKRLVGVVLGSTSGNARNRYMMAMLDQAWPLSRGGNGIVASIGGKATNTAEAAAEVPGKKKRKRYLFGSSKEETAEPTPALTTEDEDQSANETDESPATTTAFAAVDGEQAAEEPAAEAPVKLPFKVKNPARATEGGEVIVSNEPLTDAWTIQVGAFPNEDAANEKLAAAQKKAGSMLQGKRAYTVEIEKSYGRVYRARFAGFSQKSAVAACQKLDAKGIDCQPFAPQS